MGRTSRANNSEVTGMHDRQGPRPRRRLSSGALIYAIVVGAALLGAGCKLLGSTCDQDDPECLQRNLAGQGVGADCLRTVQCRPGLSCTAGTCATTGETQLGDDCSLSAECQVDLYCDPMRMCAEGGPGADGDSCADSSDCTVGYVCGFGDDLLSRACRKAGDGDLNTICSSGLDCMAGLACVPLEGRNICQSPPAMDAEIPPVPMWAGIDCEDEPTDPIAHFEVPGADALADFYRLPFPNDIRVANGKVDLSDHPRPPAALGVPVAKNFIDAADGDLTGYSTTPVVFFRLSERALSSEDRAGQKVELIPEATMLVDVTKNSPTYGEQIPVSWQLNGASKYTCGASLALRVFPEQPLQPETTYAAIVSTDLKTREDGASYGRSDDLIALLKNSAPSGSRLKAAHGVYAPLRAFLADDSVNSGMTASKVLTAAVFTTAQPTVLMAELAATVSARKAPTVSGVMLCDGKGTRDPVAECTSQASCVNSQDLYDEYHGKIRLPSFQTGEAPYERKGGAIVLDDSGKPKVVTEVDVCFALTVPKADAVGGSGFPVLIYGHGTGGSYASALGASGFAAEMAKASAPAALLAMDMPQHGSRRGDSTTEPDLLFFNIFNAPASRGNVLQGSADMMGLVQWLKRGTFEQAALDGTRIALMGHSQGATHAALMMPYEPDVSAFVLSGVGAHVSTSLRYKTKPVQIADALGALLLDLDSNGKLSGDSFNPALALLQSFYDPADPLNFASAIRESPNSEAPTGHDLFMTYGLADNYAPEATQRLYAVGGRLPLAGPVLTPIELTEVSAPVSANVNVGGQSRTIAVRQYRASDGVDGHFVASRPTEDGFPDVVRFLSQALAGDTPTVGN